MPTTGSCTLQQTRFQNDRMITPTVLSLLNYWSLVIFASDKHCEGEEH